MIRSKFRSAGAALTLMFAVLPFSAFGQQLGTVPGKYNPGHYINLTHFDDFIEMQKAAKPGVVGFQRRYDWNELETAKNQYDFSKVRADLDNAKSLGLQFVVLVTDKTFDSVNPMPGYLNSSQYVAKNKHGGYTALRWKTEVVDRFNALVSALAAEFDAHPAFEGVAFPESALSLSDTVLNNNGYSSWKYRTALISVLSNAGDAMQTSRVFWYMNYLARGRELIEDIAAAVADKGIVINGPDLLPDDWQLKSMVYPQYDKLRGIAPLAISVQFDSYSHDHKDTSEPTKYWTMAQLFAFGRDSLKVNYIFWNNMKWRSPADSYNVFNAYPVIKSNPSFNSNDWAGDWKDSDKDGLSDVTEKSIGTKVWNADSDGDGLTDGQEVNELLTNPRLADTDGGGKDDKTELNQGRNPLNGSDDYGAVPDNDNDGLSNFAELTIGSDPNKRDTDGEGLHDGLEVKVYGTNPKDRNTDRDGINDRIEIEYKYTDPLNPDTDGGGVSDGEEVKRGTNPLKAWDD